jgi:ArsR family transcriptional regulator, arsenate/arsenite/antimonite-responsive transcriptional repressor
MDTPMAAKMFGALAHEHRLAVFRMLVQSGAEGRPAGEIAAELELLPSTLSFHLSALEGAGLVRSMRTGRYIRYGLRPEAICSLLDFLTEDCCGGHPEQCGLPRATSPEAADG